MLKVRVSKVTSEYLRDDLAVEPGVWYEASRGKASWDGSANVRFPGTSSEDNLILLDGHCAHLYDNEQTEWEVSDA